MRGARLRTAPIRTPASLARTRRSALCPSTRVAVLEGDRSATPARVPSGGGLKQTNALTYYDAAKIKPCFT